MMKNLIRFFKKLQKDIKINNHDLKIGITITMDDLRKTISK